MAGESQQEPRNAPDPSVVTTENIDKAVDNLRAEVAAWLAGRDAVMAERDLRYIERFNAQETAMRAAFAAADKAVDKALVTAEKAVDARAATLDREFHEHLEQVRHENDLAFANSDKAINKAEVATEKRFESVNEFRGQLNDQANLFLPRTEYDARHANLEDRVTDLTDRLNRAEGVKVGGNEQRAAVYAFVGFLATALVLVTVLAANGMFSS